MAVWKDKRTGRWKGQYTDPATGRRPARTFDLKKEAAAWVADQRGSIRRGAYVDPRSLTEPLRGRIEQWLADRQVERTTLATNRARVQRILADWGGVPVGSVTYTSVQTWVTKLGKTGMAPATVRGYHGLLSSILETARRDRLLPDNPARGVDRPAVPPPDENWLTVEEVWGVAGRQDDDDATVTTGLAYTGMRWGEFAGLGRHCVDLPRRQLAVRRTLIEVDGQKLIKEYPKGRRRRVVPVPDPWLPLLVDYMGRWRADREEIVFAHLGEQGMSRHYWPRFRFYPALCAELGCPPELAEPPRRKPGPKPGAPVARDGKRYAHRREVSRSDERHNCRGVTPHDLRHTYASWMAQDGVELYRIAALLGDTVATTERHYAHLKPGHFDEALRALGGE